MTKAETAIIETGKRVISLQAEGLETLSASLGGDFLAATRLIMAVRGRVIVTGIGKSGHIARKIASTLSSTGTSALYVHPSEASHGDLGMISAEDLIIALSRSGETSELGDLVAHAQAADVPLIAMTGIQESTLARTAGLALIIPNVDEACSVTGAPTTSTSMMLALGDALAVTLMEQRGFTADDFRRFHPGGQLGAMLRTVEDLMHTGVALPLVKRGESLNRALAIMSEGGFGCVGVLGSDGGLVGMVTDGDIRRHLMDQQSATMIDDVMTRNPVTLVAGMRATEALALLNAKRITQVFVLEAEKPVGIVHMHDFLRAGLR